MRPFSRAPPLLLRQPPRPDSGVARKFLRIQSASEKQRGQSRDDFQVFHYGEIRSRGFFGCFFFLAFAHKSPRRIVRYELSCFARIYGASGGLGFSKPPTPMALSSPQGSRCERLQYRIRVWTFP